MTDFGVVTEAGEKHIYKGSATSHPKGRAQRLQSFGTPTYAQTVWPRATTWGRSVFLGDQSRSQLPTNFWDPYMHVQRRTWYEKKNQILHGDLTKCRENFCKST